MAVLVACAAPFSEAIWVAGTEMALTPSGGWNYPAKES